MVTYNDVIKQTLVLLQQNRSEWENRYKGYITKIRNNANKHIKVNPSVKEPLFVYTTISNETKPNPVRYLRFMGQNVGCLLQKKENYSLLISEEDQKKSCISYCLVHHLFRRLILFAFIFQFNDCYIRVCPFFATG